MRTENRGQARTEKVLSQVILHHILALCVFFFRRSSPVSPEMISSPAFSQAGMDIKTGGLVILNPLANSLTALVVLCPYIGLLLLQKPFLSFFILLSHPVNQSVFD